jgi:hypothetical protein
MKKVTTKLGVLIALFALIAGALTVKLYRQKHRPATSTAYAPLTPADVTAMATAACAAPTGLDDKKAITCSICPTGSDFANQAGMPGAAVAWTHDGVLPGHFTAAKADEALFHATGCESHARNYGGDFIMRRTAGTWSVVRYAPGATANDKCQKFKWQQDRDAVICEATDMGQGIAYDGVQFLLFDATPPPPDDFSNTTFIGLSDETGNCGTQQPHNGPAALMQFGKIDAVKIIPASTKGDDKADLGIEATVERARIVPTAAGVCPKGRRRSYKIAFKNMEDHFEAQGGYQEVAMQKREDCCEITINKTVRPGKY